MNANISAWAIRSPIPSLVLFIILLIAGTVGFIRLPINATPNIDVPNVSVTVTQPGAAPAELETEVTRKIEDAVAGLGNVDHIRSTVNDGISTTNIDFVIGINTDRAVNDVRDAVAKIRQNLPQDINDPVVARVDFVGGPVVTYTVSSKSLTIEELSWFVDNDLARDLLSVRGVSQVQRSGGVNREVRINLLPDRLVAFGITADDVGKQLRGLNVNLPGGRGTVGGAEQSIRTLGSALTVDALREAEIALPNKRKVRLSDIATVEDGAAEARQSALLDNRPVVAFSVLRSVGSSEVAIARGVDRKLIDIRAQRPDIEVRKIVDFVLFAERSYESAIEALLLGALLATGVVWWFLRDTRATIISGLAMPLSTIPTFAVMQFLGFSLNNVSLLALSLVVGILVDDAIVEIENIVRHIRQGRRPYAAALEAADEIGLAVIATTMTIIVVFLPVSFMGGIPGQFFRQFGITVAVAVFFSLLVARLLTPMMAAYFLKPHPEPPPPGLIFRSYTKLLGWSLRHRFLSLLAAIGVFAGSVALVPLIPQGFLPIEDISLSNLSIELPPGATLADTERAAATVTDVIRKRPEVTGVYASIGAPVAAMFGQSQEGETRKATLYIILKPRADRVATQKQFEQIIQPALKEIPGIRFGFGSSGGGKEVSIIIAGNDAAALERTSDQLTREMQTLPILANVNSTASLKRPELMVRPRLDRAAELGISVQQISQVAKIATIGDIDSNLAKFNLADRQIPIRVQIDPKARGDLAILENLRVTGANGVAVPLKTVADIELGSSPSQIDRFDRSRKVTIEADLNGAPLGAALNAIYALPAAKSLPPTLKFKSYGNAENMAVLFAEFATAIGAGILLIFGVLILLFGGFVQPFTIMMALPLSIGGAFAALMITQESLSLPALIGILMLMGIVTKNAILLVEYAIVAMREGTPRFEALMHAGEKRARPIVMTTVAMVAGMLPIASRMGENSDFQAPMAIVVIGGLITSTALSLVFVPVVFTYMDDLQRWLGRHLSRVLATSEKDRLEAAE